MGRGDAGRWGDRDVVADYATSGWSDEGERLALQAAAPWARGDVLDVGVGGGRTTGLLLPGARSYTGVEPSPEMLDLARRRWPAARLLLDDARTLTSQDDASADLVVFSFNGLDSLDRDDRVVALRRLAAVVRPEGRVLLSSLDRDGPSWDERPLRLRPGSPVDRLLQVARLVRHPRRTARAVLAFRRTRDEAVDGDGWGMRAMRAHGFRFVVHLATVGDTVRLLRDNGLEPVAIWDDAGTPVALDTEHHGGDWLQYLCRPAAPAAPA